MNKTLYQVFLICVFLIGNTVIGYGQIIDYSRENPYKKVFVETDNFGVSYLNILEEAYPKVQNDTIRYSILNDLAYYWHSRNLVTAQYFTKKGLDLTSGNNNELWYGRFQITQAAILLRMEKLDSALITLDSAREKVKKEDLAFLNTQLGYIYERKGEIDKSAEYALESLRLGKALNDKRAMAIAYSDLSNLFWKQSKFEKGLEFGLRSVKIFEELGFNGLDYDFTLYVVGNNYLALKNYQKAINYYEHCISIGERYGFYNNLSDAYISLVNLYAFLNEFEKAEVAGSNAVKYAEILYNNFMLMRSWLSVGKLQYLQGKFLSSIESLEKSIEIATENFGDEYYLSQAYEALGKSYAGSHNYKEAYLAYAEYDRLKNKIFTAEADHRISLLQTELEVADKENTIQVQETELKKQGTRQLLISVITALLFLLLILLFMTYRINKRKNRLLEKKNKEKEFLLKEIHHRVKNNLGIVSSLLALQSEQIDDPAIKDVMLESQNRVYSMGMIHQNLYQGKDLGTIEMKDYFVNLGHHIIDSYGVEDRILIAYPMEKLELDIDTAIPLGLIVNELLTNSLKYAFPDNRKGNIIISLQEIDTAMILLEVSDDGIGQSQDELVRGTGFGTQLVKLLSQQLNGKISQNSEKGTSVSFEFTLDNAA